MGYDIDETSKRERGGTVRGLIKVLAVFLCVLFVFKLLIMPVVGAVVSMFVTVVWVLIIAGIGLGAWMLWRRGGDG